MESHKPISIDKFQGLYDRGTLDEAPLDHFSECVNIQFKGWPFGTRDGLGISQATVVPLNNVKREYNYPTQTANTKLVLTNDGTTGRIYHVVNESLQYGPILSINGMEDFAFVPYAGRAYITPFFSYTNGDLIFQKGMQSQFLYVYAGDGTAARKAAGATPAGTLTIANGAAGHTTAGMHVFGVVGETDSGYLSAPIALNNFLTSSGLSVSFTNVPTFTGTQWIRRHIVASIAIPAYDGNLEGYQLFFIPGAVINDNTTTVLSNVSFYDIELLDDASHLFENYSEIPAGAALWLYHDRLCIAATYNDISIVLVSHPGEPEAINQISGLIIVPPDGNPITNGAELRDVCYIFKRSKTTSRIDNEGDPADWPEGSVDNSYGTCVHGIATVLDSGQTTVDYFLICTYGGILQFNGRYILPELSWKISNLWANQERNEYRRIQIVICPPRSRIYVVMPDSSLLIGDYGNGLDKKGIRWHPFSFDQVVNCVCIVNIDEIEIGMDIPF